MKFEKYAIKQIKNIRVFVKNEPGYLGKLLTLIGDLGGNIGDFRLIKKTGTRNFREIEIYVQSEEHIAEIIAGIKELEGVQFDSVIDSVLRLHEGGKIQMTSRIHIEQPSDLRKAYTPGVAKVCQKIQESPELAWRYTYLKKTVAIVTNGSAILGLGDIGPLAGMPVMEGKSVLLNQLVGLNGIPILIDEKDPEKIIEIIKSISSSFGAIKLEDFAAPDCFTIEQKLIKEINKPIMHDDQHGTAVVVLAALINATQYAKQDLKSAQFAIVGLGAAGIGIAKLLKSYGVKKLLGVDISEVAKSIFSEYGQVASLEEAMEQAQIVLATTGVPKLIKPEMIRKNQIILALSNPNPEIHPKLALESGAAFAADGRGVNNALAFPGIFKGALKASASEINNQMKILAAEEIAKLANKNREELVPPLLNKKVHEAVSLVVEKAAYESNVANKITYSESKV